MAETKTDEDIIAEVVAGNTDAFGLIVSKYYRVVFSVSYRYLNHYQDAEDMTQEVFTRAFAKAGEFEAYGSIYRWLMRITINLCINEARSARRRLTQLREMNDVPAAAGEEGMMDFQMKQDIQKVIGDLPSPQRMALILSRYEGLTYGEIAHMMDRSVSSVESLLVRAKRTLMKKLEKYTVQH
ncbi:MAG: RNA polymerase sigma factor [Pseudomonadota bacterium]